MILPIVGFLICLLLALICFGFAIVCAADPEGRGSDYVMGALAGCAVSIVGVVVFAVVALHHLLA